MAHYKFLENELEKDIFSWANAQTYLADSTVNSRIWHVVANNTTFEIVYDFAGTLLLYRRPTKWCCSSTNQVLLAGKDDYITCKNLIGLIADNLIDYPY